MQDLEKQGDRPLFHVAFENESDAISKSDLVLAGDMNNIPVYVRPGFDIKAFEALSAGLEDHVDHHSDDIRSEDAVVYAMYKQQNRQSRNIQSCFFEPTNGHTPIEVARAFIFQVTRVFHDYFGSEDGDGKSHRVRVIAHNTRPKIRDRFDAMRMCSSVRDCACWLAEDFVSFSRSEGQDGLYDPSFQVAISIEIDGQECFSVRATDGVLRNYRNERMKVLKQYVSTVDNAERENSFNDIVNRFANEAVRDGNVNALFGLLLQLYSRADIGKIPSVVADAYALLGSDVNLQSRFVLAVNRRISGDAVNETVG